MHKYNLVIAVMAGCLTAACSPQVRGEGKGSGSTVMSLTVQADPQLNRYEKTSHALMLCLYQLREPEGFRLLVQARDGLPRLLECGRFDASVVSARQIVVQPGQTVSQNCDKVEGARYLGLATGYYHQGKKATELVPLPTESRGGRLRVDLGALEIAGARVE
ncbi:type VI secretion system lipoprotein TssJ [Geomonas ferrireducens]|jgi:type VI secretion system VasD/TssJ family lipoprotein|uniref:type VI secretion system lipoprotein TssJ n=1 Tax=Geomonas ferrireducens TaxID=2570227 RepID=UPI0010A94A91|nr:type VI secretion system lipoprotein TssJ [Geomonas ferrireducens]